MEYWYHNLTYNEPERCVFVSVFLSMYGSTHQGHHKDNPANTSCHTHAIHSFPLIPLLDGAFFLCVVCLLADADVGVSVRLTLVSIFFGLIPQSQLLVSFDNSAVDAPPHHVRQEVESSNQPHVGPSA